LNALLVALSQRAETAPGEPLLIGEDVTLSVAETLAQVRELSLQLRAADVTTVALLADNSPDWIVLDVACQLEGIRCVPVPTFFTRSQIAHVVDSAGVDLLFYQPELLQQLAAVERRECPRWESLPRYAVARPKIVSPSAAPAGTGKITFTSGSTGQPKGVCLSFDQCLAVADSLAKVVAVPNPRHLCVLPLSTLLENIGGVYMPMLAGGSSVVLPATRIGMCGSSGVDATAFVAAIDRCQPHTMILVPQLLTVLDVALAGGWRPPEILRFVAVGGARVSPAVVERVRERGLPVYEGYGLSECASVVSLNRPGADRPGTSGKVLPHLDVVARDGELTVRGNTFLGYLNQPETWYAGSVETGDIGSVDADGYVTVQGRRKDVLVNSYGRNISPEWVETELLADGVFQQAVVVGDSRPHCAALLYPRKASLAASAYQAAVDEVNRRLPDYARVGAWLRLEEPLSAADGMLTNNGRPKRERILAHYRAGIDALYGCNEELLAS
jgi:long-chain acyl-CoA synthetase